jgi:hypothetical protein
VIVVAYQSGDALTRCLESLAGEDVIVVDNDADNVGFGAGSSRLACVSWSGPSF